MQLRRVRLVRESVDVANDSAIRRLLDEANQLRVNEEKPHCWLVRLPFWPWRHRAAFAQRRELISRLLRLHDTVALGVTNDDNVRSDEVLWRVSRAAAFTLSTEDEIEFGAWILVFFHQEPPSALPSSLSIRCEDLQVMLAEMMASAAVVSLPDDAEWIIVEAHQGPAIR
jgi:hypothetical protein